MGVVSAPFSYAVVVWGLFIFLTLSGRVGCVLGVGCSAVFRRRFVGTLFVWFLVCGPRCVLASCSVLVVNRSFGLGWVESRQVSGLGVGFCAYWCGVTGWLSRWSFCVAVFVRGSASLDLMMLGFLFWFGPVLSLWPAAVVLVCRSCSGPMGFSSLFMAFVSEVIAFGARSRLPGCVHFFRVTSGPGRVFEVSRGAWESPVRGVHRSVGLGGVFCQCGA
ncbi:hypothetical protein L359_06531 [Enterobacter hormaechei subsp. hoffmannii MGH 13]|nr:hypothetical protein L359_06531 [Enterobacter hormaechei subsp. hoffmannii MGH 13]